MAAFERHIPLCLGTSSGLFTISTTANTYQAIDPISIAQIAVAQYNSGAFYYEATLKTSAATGYATLYNITGGAAVSGGEITTTSTSIVRVRSSALTLTGSDDYSDRIKNDGANTTTFYGGRVVVLQNSAGISATEAQVIVFSYTTNTTTNAAYVQPGTIGDAYWLYTAANWDGATFYYEATLKTSAATGYSQLHTVGGSALSGAEVTTTSTSFVRVRSSAITPVDGTAYKAMIKNDGGNTTSFNSSRVIIQQTNPTKTEAYLPFNADTAASATGGSYADHQSRVLWDPATWSGDSVAWSWETNSLSGGAFGSSRVFNIDAAGAVTGASTSMTGSLTERLRAGGVTMPVASATLRAETNSAAGTHYMAVCKLIAVMSWTNVFPVVGANPNLAYFM